MIVKCPEEIKKDPSTWEVFLAGPIQGAPEWQFTLPDLQGIRWISPRRESYEDFEYEPQVDWETRMLRRANIVLFYIPKAEDTKFPDYAKTTRTEFGEMLGRGKKIFAGIYDSFPGRRYFESKLQQYDPQAKLYRSLGELVEAVLSWINAQKPGTYFTADTHFSSPRALELSKRPFNTTSEMDWTMIERWNNKVVPGSTVYHLGDFGDTWALNELGGNIIRIAGNYERDEGNIDKLPNELQVGDYYLCHEPCTVKSKTQYNKLFGLFGHIHGRQKVKMFGIDVGVDANNYTPMSQEEVEFYRNAIRKGYYDDEVWC